MSKLVILLFLNIFIDYARKEAASNDTQFDPKKFHLCQNSNLLKTYERKRTNIINTWYNKKIYMYANSYT